MQVATRFSQALPSSQVARPLVVFRVGAQHFALEATDVRGAVRRVNITPVPLAPAGLAGITWQQGKAISVVDIRAVLDIPPRHESVSASVLMVMHQNETVALLVDKIEDVVNVTSDAFSPTPVTMEENWKRVIASVVEQPRGLIAVVDIAGVLSALTV